MQGLTLGSAAIIEHMISLARTFSGTETQKSLITGTKDTPNICVHESSLPHFKTIDDWNFAFDSNRKYWNTKKNCKGSFLFFDNTTNGPSDHDNTGFNLTPNTELLRKLSFATESQKKMYLT